MSVAAPFALPNGQSFRNRIAKAAMTEGLAFRDGLPNPAHDNLYRRWADRGCGLLITGNVIIDRGHLERPGNVIVDGPLGSDGKAAWARWAAAATSSGTQAWVQINHAGRQTQKSVNPHPRAPSAVPLALPGGQFGMPVPLTGVEIPDLIARWANAAAIAREAGFTGVQVHAAHGYLISQFLSPLANQRRDEWGGALENRARFLTETVKAVRAAVGSDFTLSVKLNSADFQKGGFAFDECITVAGWLADLGVDCLELSGGTYEQPAMMDMEGLTPREEPKQSSSRQREAYFVQLAKALMQAKTPPLMVTGGFRTLNAMEDAIASGIALVGVGRPLCAEPDCVTELVDGHIEELPRFEDRLAIGPGWLGPASPFKLVRTINGFAAQAWYYQQIRRVAANGAAEKLNPFKAFLAEDKENKARA
ncbi:NADH:flavin oxidoreductase [Sandarakinorhabdus cyanobacteriorum]|uniref:NADH:flavin oxidoreductase n=1 Tax=Sandarakinorhabdus cyanobacteriorum TaxID=1981098 RepID=A0A255YD23_9SPHN|nr:NADH:flavin oxidoreductase [Sandarakinorhabdus cyanobacteriorum]OYQ27073.1 NADH:flavin oxidoreductase [Sandarakinorhabdus cyanobacteriorum]